MKSWLSQGSSVSRGTLPPCKQALTSLLPSQWSAMYLQFPCYCYFSEANAPESDRKDLLSELELMTKLKPHPHVIKLIGCVTESGNKTLRL